jgi:hypothetical protein
MEDTMSDNHGDPGLGRNEPDEPVFGTTQPDEPVFGTTEPDEPVFTGIDDHEQTSDARALVRSGWHRVNIGHLVMGLAFLCFVGAWALVQADVVTGDEVRWLLPIPWLVAGAVGLVTVAVSSARRHGVRR